MSRYRCIVLLSLLPLLQACLQVELTGPVVGATISVAELRGGKAVVDGLVTSDAAAVQALVGVDRWASLRNQARRALLGAVAIPEEMIEDETYYLVTASGGADADADGDRIIDGKLAPLARELRAIVTGAQLKQRMSRVTVLSEAIYRALELELDGLTDEQLGQRLDQLASAMIAKSRPGAASNYGDVLRWSQVSQAYHYKGADVFLQRLPRGVLDATYDDDIVTADSLNLVMWPSLEPARDMADWSEALPGCAFPVVIGDLCNYQLLPLIGMLSDRPDVESVMSRLVVSESWMADRFEQFLYQMPDDILLLFRSATAVVISDNIRPSYFWGPTGALYLDAEYFWLSADERPANATADPRVEFSTRLSFADLWRYVKDSRDVSVEAFRVDVNGNRNLEAATPDVAALLFHELAHAADFIRPALISSIPRNLTPFDNFFQSVSDNLIRQSPLRSPELAGVANVLFFGAPATPAEAGYSATDIGRFFDPDRANDLYSYASQYEDLAMLFEETMMAIHFGVTRDLAFTSQPASPQGAVLSCENFQVGWGVRGRIAASQVLPRAKNVIVQLLPERNYLSQMDRFPAPIAMDTSRDWCENLLLAQGKPAGLPSMANAAIPGIATVQRALSRRRL